jgi:hypothetical protein
VTDLVGVYHGGTQSGEELGDGALATADASGKTYDFHSRLQIHCLM